MGADGTVRVRGGEPSARPGFWRCVAVGLMAGAAASALVIPVAVGLQTLAGRTYPELAPGHLAQATVLSTLLGAVTFYAAMRWTRRPLLVFALLAGGFAVGYSVVVALQPPAPGFAAVVTVLHLVVAAVTVAAFGVVRERLWTVAPPGLRGYALIVTTLTSLFLVAFVVVESLGIPLLTDPSPWLADPGVAAALVGVGLLLADVVLPVPASAVMVAHGALFGVAAGTVLSLVGGLGATLLGFALGRRSSSIVDRLVHPDSRRRAERWLQTYGPMAIVATRPVPMVAETTAIVAGTSPMRWGWAAAAGAAGNLVPAFLYAVTGSVATSLTNQTVVFAVVLGVAAIFWLLGRRVGAPARSLRTSRRPPRGGPGR